VNVIPIQAGSDLVFADDSSRNFLKRDMKKAPQVGLEPTTLRLTAGCSAIELLRSNGTDGAVFADVTERI
jgi:hypothetical protein